MRVVITGAAGAIASVVVEELGSLHELRLLDIRPMAHADALVADLSQRPGYDSADWDSTFSGAEVVIHLAANMQSLAPWEKVLPDNIQATWHVFEAAARHRVPRLVYASSNWAVKSLEQQLAPSCYQPDGPKIDSQAFACPVNAYGLSKAFGEMAGRMFVDEKKFQSFVAVRIGNFSATPSSDPVVRARWIGVEDMRSLMRRCVEADFSGFHVVYGVSAQASAPYDLSHSRELLGWQPKQRV